MITERNGEYYMPSAWATNRIYTRGDGIAVTEMLLEKAHRGFLLFLCKRYI